MLSNAQDFDAINEFMKRTPAVTPEAVVLKSSWSTWFSTLSWWDKNMSETAFDEASTRRNKFNLANAVSQKEKDLAVRVMTTGFDKNQAQGKPRKQTLETGEVGSQIKKPTLINTTGQPTIKQGSKGPVVAKWQTAMGVKADGNFGPGTHKTTVEYQKRMSLKADGVVGPQTWASLSQDDVVEAPSLISSLFGTKTSSPSPKQAVQSRIPSKGPVSAGTAKPSTASVAAKAADTSVPTAKPGVVASLTETVKTKANLISEAGMFGSIEKLPLWAKVAGGSAIVAAMIFGRNPSGPSLKRRQNGLILGLKPWQFEKRGGARSRRAAR
jgi:hypothetical protein